MIVTRARDISSLAFAAQGQGAGAPPRGAANKVSVRVHQFAPQGRPKARIAPPRGAANKVSVGVHQFAPQGQGAGAPPRGAANEVSVGALARLRTPRYRPAPNFSSAGGNGSPCSPLPIVSSP